MHVMVLSGCLGRSMHVHGHTDIGCTAQRTPHMFGCMHAHYYHTSQMLQNAWQTKL